jgi:hypothetical protein
MLKALLIIFLLASQALLAQDVAVFNDRDITTLFHDEQRTFQCERYKKLSSYFDEQGSVNLEEQIQGEIAGHNLLLHSKQLSFKERSLIRKNKRILKKLLKFQNKKEGLKKVFRKAL